MEISSETFPYQYNLCQSRIRNANSAFKLAFRDYKYVWDTCICLQKLVREEGFTRKTLKVGLRHLMKRPRSRHVTLVLYNNTPRKRWRHIHGWRYFKRISKLLMLQMEGKLVSPDHFLTEVDHTVQPDLPFLGRTMPHPLSGSSSAMADIDSIPLAPLMEDTLLDEDLLAEMLSKPLLDLDKAPPPAPKLGRIPRRRGQTGKNRPSSRVLKADGTCIEPPTAERIGQRQIHPSKKAGASATANAAVETRKTRGRERKKVEDSTTANATVRTGQKRGRPRKKGRDSITANAEVGMVGGRGRPRKKGGDSVTAKAAEGMGGGRGRPRKKGGESVPAKAAERTGRGRGRPRKDRGRGSLTSNATVTATPPLLEKGNEPPMPVSTTSSLPSNPDAQEGPKFILEKGLNPSDGSALLGKTTMRSAFKSPLLQVKQAS